jgi:nucleotide-binding universal stress UspA family protein
MGEKIFAALKKLNEISAKVRIGAVCGAVNRRVSVARAGTLVASTLSIREAGKEVLMSTIKKILAPTDFSETSKAGVRHALEMARGRNAEVLVYHAIDAAGEWKERPPAVKAYRDMLADSRKALEKFLADNFADCIDLVEVRCSAEFGTPHKNIVEKAEAEGSDMIVMSTHGRTGIDHLILGSTTEKVVARASCPVLVVPRSGHDGNIAKAA